MRLEEKYVLNASSMSNKYSMRKMLNVVNFGMAEESGC